MASNPNNIRLSACRVRWGGRDLGLTKGGVDVTVKTDTKPINVDQFGQSVVNEYIIGRTITVKCPFAESDLDTLYAIMKLSGATLTDAGTVATGTLTFTGQPVANDTIILNGHTFTFVTTLPTGANGVPLAANQILIGGSVALTVANAAAVIAVSTDPAVLAAIYTPGASAITIAYYRSGVIGNTFTLAKSSTNITVSGATLSGGLDGTRNVIVTTGIGISLLTNAVPLLLHPADLLDSDTSQDFLVYNAGQSGSITFAYKIDNERVYSVDFTAFPNYLDAKLFKFGT